MGRVKMHYKYEYQLLHLVSVLTYFLSFLFVIIEYLLLIALM